MTQKIYIFDDGSEYLSPKGLIPVDKKRQLTFEMVQLLTGLPEPAPDVALRNRGAVVFFTDKILQQAQFTYEKQLVYVLATEENPLRQRRLLTYQLEANRAMNLEDRLIDSLVHEESGCSASCRKKDPGCILSQPMRHYFLSMRILRDLGLKKKSLGIA